MSQHGHLAVSNTTISEDRPIRCNSLKELYRAKQTYVQVMIPVPMVLVFFLHAVTNLLLNSYVIACRCVMMEQRRDAHRGSEGLSQTWLGVIARARLRARYMNLYRRLLTVGMRPLASSAEAAAAVTTTEERPAISRRRTAPAFPSVATIPGPIPASPALRKSSSARETEQLEMPSQGSMSVAAGENRTGDGQADGPGGSSAEIRRLGDQIRNRAGKVASVARHISMEVQRELQVRVHRKHNAALSSSDVDSCFPRTFLEYM